MKDITAILINYTNPNFLHRAINSLNTIRTRLKSIIVLKEKKSIVDHTYNWIEKIEFIAIKEHDLRKTINQIINQIESTYIFFLQNTEYVSPTLKVHSLNLPQTKEVMETIDHNNIHQPVLIRTLFLKKQPFFLSPLKRHCYPLGSATSTVLIDMLKKTL